MSELLKTAAAGVVAVALCAPAFAQGPGGQMQGGGMGSGKMMAAEHDEDEGDDFRRPRRGSMRGDERPGRGMMMADEEEDDDDDDWRRRGKRDRYRQAHGMSGWRGHGMMMMGMMGHGVMGPGMMGPGMSKMMIVLLDSDNDGALSYEELEAVHRRMFKMFDADGDGKLTTKEMGSFRERLMSDDD